MARRAFGAGGISLLPRSDRRVRLPELTGSRGYPFRRRGPDDVHGDAPVVPDVPCPLTTGPEGGGGRFQQEVEARGRAEVRPCRNSPVCPRAPLPTSCVTRPFPSTVNADIPSPVHRRGTVYKGKLGSEPVAIKNLKGARWTRRRQSGPNSPHSSCSTPPSTPTRLARRSSLSLRARI